MSVETLAKPINKSKRNIKIKTKEFTFIDLFAGIGGFRLGMEQAGFNCVFSVVIFHLCSIITIYT